MESVKIAETKRGVMFHMHSQLPSAKPVNEPLDRRLLLEKLQSLSVAMLRTATAAMAVRNPEAEVAYDEVAGGFLAFSGSDVPLTRAIGVGTAGPINHGDITSVETFFRSRNSPVSIVMSERTDPSLQNLLASRGYQASDHLQNWWLELDVAPNKTIPSEIQVAPASTDESELWVRTVAAGFLETQSPVEDSELPSKMLDIFYCLGFANGAQPFLARWNGIVAGGGVLHISDGTAQIRTASCRFTHRRMGVQTAVLRARLDAALRAGCRLAFSSTDGDGPSARNLARFGFKPLSVSFRMSTSS